MDNSVVAILFFAILCCGIYYVVRKTSFIEPRPFSWNTPPSVWNNYQPISKTAAPITSVYYGKLELGESPLPISGTLSIRNNCLVLHQAYGNIISLPLNEIRWISHQNMSQAARDLGPSHEAITLHCEGGGRWWVYSFSSPKAELIAQEIAIQTQANYKPSYTIGGPVRANLRSQDIYGQWQLQGTAMLYLTPDRLLADWETWIELRQIQNLELLPNKMLQITYLSDGLHIVGLNLDHDQAILWAELLARATGLKAENLAGRKKKSEAE
jgi:hypothetical protein